MNQPELSHLQTLNLISTQLASIATQILNSKLEAGPSNLSSEPDSVNELLPEAASLFATLKAVNRLSSSTVGDCKSKTNQARAELDSIHLGLQNLVYERRHLEREIKKCHEFESEYQNIAIHPIEEFVSLMEASGTPVPSDSHELMLARLRYELAERKRFEGEKKELLQRKVKLSKDNDEKKAKLDELEKQLDQFVISTKEIQAKMAAQA
ncbi:uncharacterized protein MELLADRAFT_71565 [Melampsora larici-populina 98AG31]|uniref:Uncharacterized protein n=1 Tax=Melampsora larici-populina (strain 98AG31 / pathotype 3-4-7) TaxID=747676 RepID=F4RHX2_MELLP|nr:uncharacterized protein MELLADRAFT_71565 [Melampsora larici-populina 98AG31]EGG08057.1 hypothetical protein MELLADRAFT_71565 [Melampsora larici-populina 98AG31]